MNREGAFQIASRPPTRRGVLWLGLKCDVRCIFCYDELVHPGDKRWLDLSEIEAALEKFAGYYGNNAIDFMGGEPTLHPHIYEIVRRSAELGLRTTIITHGMRLSDIRVAEAFEAAGIYDFLVSIHAVGDEAVRSIHRRGSDNFAKQLQGLNNLKTLGIPFRFNCTLVKENISHLVGIAELAVEKGARVVNFLTFNPYFEWGKQGEIPFQARHSEIAPALSKAIEICTANGVEANVRYMPLCQLPQKEHHLYTGHQLPFDTHEWDYNSWYDCGHAGPPSEEWYREAARQQSSRHHYRHVEECGGCAARLICDGFHEQYIQRWGGSEARPLPGAVISDPKHFVRRQTKYTYENDAFAPRSGPEPATVILTTTQFSSSEGNRAGVRTGMPKTHSTLSD
jgi:sulfatase maturation enzyme AslB (radical SAM superfamily)